MGGEGAVRRQFRCWGVMAEAREGAGSVERSAWAQGYFKVKPIGIVSGLEVEWGKAM